MVGLSPVKLTTVARPTCAQGVYELLVVQPAEAFLGQQRPGAVTHQALEPVAVPVRNRHRGVDRPAAGMVGGVEGMDGRVVEVVANRTVQEGGCRPAWAVDGRAGVR
jgi:hypothetical protein